MPELRGTVVLATYNSGASVGPVLAEIEEAASLLRRSGIELDVLLVDDSSPDNTAAIAIDEAARLGIKLEVLSGSHLGLGRSQLAGFEHLLRGAARDFFVTLDPDGHHDARQITDVVRTFVARQSGVTIGSRWVRGGSSPGTSALRSVVSRTANMLARRIIGLHGVHDATTSFRIIRPDVAQLWIDRQIPADGYGYFTTSVAVAQAAGFSVTECPITFRPRYAGVRSLSFADVAAFWRSLHATRVLVADVRGESRPRPGHVGGTFTAHASPTGLVELAVRRGRGAGEPRPGEPLLRMDRRRAEATPRPSHPRGRRGHRHHRDQDGRAQAGQRDHGDRARREPVRRAAVDDRRVCRNVTALQLTSQELAATRPAAVRFHRLRQRARAHPRRRCRDAHRVRARRARRFAGGVRAGDVAVVRQPRLQVGAPSSLRQGPAARR